MLHACLLFFSVGLKRSLGLGFSRSKAATEGVLEKKLFLKISQSSQESTCIGNFIKKRLGNRCFPAKFAKILRILFFIEHLRATAFDRLQGNIQTKPKHLQGNVLIRVNIIIISATLSSEILK